MQIKKGNYIYYEDCFGFRHGGTIISVNEKEQEFLISNNPNTSMPQMDDSMRTLKFSDENKLFWLNPTPEHPIPLEVQQKMQNNK